MRTTINLNPRVIKWARERAKFSIDDFAKKMKVSNDIVLQWETDGKLSFPKIRKIAEKARIPLGYLFLEAPISETLPIYDFRTIAEETPVQPSPELLETIRLMQYRQEWIRDLLIENGVDTLKFVKSVSIKDNHIEVANNIRKTLGISSNWAKEHYAWAGALRTLKEKIDGAGIFIFTNGVVENNNHRTLDVQEFRGFVLCDEYAPLIFVNGADALSAQMFTIAHELAHIWVGQDGLFDLYKTFSSKEEVEVFCNKVAAEFLVPSEELTNKKIDIETMAGRFKVSPIVIARRYLDLNYISKKEFFDFYDDYTSKEFFKKTKSTGGNFWHTQHGRIGDNFGMMVIIAAKEGRLLYRDAYNLTGLYGETFDKYCNHLGIPV
ncbi:helix-turn-helix XRE-family transcriptional regulators [Candidatus Termititenax persephonae]|uniref:Helix-turn-helix XRE-family transcriptional regulators n=1 Tax=Candidatus Termititenax persephonae TaxID=2218525 RepID=A0A388TI72_9BACT|nr:helix-turn-helix XRE-family transcriptional regulators [Candidatus Termititenax persephonae]